MKSLGCISTCHFVDIPLDMDRQDFIQLHLAEPWNQSLLNRDEICTAVGVALHEGLLIQVQTLCDPGLERDMGAFLMPSAKQLQLIMQIPEMSNEELDEYEDNLEEEYYDYLSVEVKDDEDVV